MSTSVTWNNTVRSIPAAGELNWAALHGFLVDLGNNAQTTNFQKLGMRVATTTPVSVSATTDCIVVSKLAAPGAVTVNLPAGTITGQVFVIVDGTGDAAVNPITIDGNGAETINGAATYIVGVNRGGLILSWTGTEWFVLGEFVGDTSGAPLPYQATDRSLDGSPTIASGTAITAPLLTIPTGKTLTIDTGAAMHTVDPIITGTLVVNGTGVVVVS